MTIVTPSRWQRDGLFGFLAVALAFAIGRGLLGSDLTTSTVVIVVILAVVLVLVVVGWARLVRRGDRLEVTTDAIRYVSGSGKANHVLSRADGPEIRLVVRSGGRMSYLALSQVRTESLIPLHLFSKADVAEACQQYGWHLSG